jgi:Fur family transcriptional regulator, ferric uptake regulator
MGLGSGRNPDTSDTKYQMVRQALGKTPATAPPAAAPPQMAQAAVAVGARAAAEMPEGADDCELCTVPVSDGAHIVRALRLAGYQVTPPRAAVVRAVAAQPRPFTAGHLCAAVAALDPTVGRATVFRTLELLVDAGVLDRLHAVRGDASYVARDPSEPDQAHHYLVCSACDGVTKVADADLGPLLRAVAARHAFRADGGLLEITGRCQAC